CLGRRSLEDRLTDGFRVGRLAEDRLLLGGEVVEERSGGDVSRLADRFHRHLVEPALQDQGQRRFTERLAGGQLLALTSPQPRRGTLDRHERNGYPNRYTYATLQQCKADV